MPAPRKYDQETRERAVRMYRERRREHPEESAIESRRQIGALIDVKSETPDNQQLDTARPKGCARLAVES